MIRNAMKVSVALGVLSAAIAGDALARDPQPNFRRRNAVFAMTNAPSGNAVVAYDREGDGSLVRSGTFATLGLGAAPRPIDPLLSQGALTISPSGHLLFAVNAGSDDLSVFTVGENDVTLSDVIPSGGQHPVSVTAHGDLVYVLNAGGSGSIAGFRAQGNGTLDPIPGSIRDLHLAPGSATPGQIGFDPGGRFLVLSGRGAHTLSVFPLDAGGLPSAAPVTTASDGLVPFDFAFDHAGHLVVAETGGHRNAPPGGTSVVSSYEILDDGSLSVISGSVDDGQRATCWIAGESQHGYVITANTGSNTLSTFKVNADGSITLAQGAAASFPAGTLPTDIAVSRDGRFVYTLNGGVGTVGSFDVGSDGSLRAHGAGTGLAPASGLQGIAAR